MKQLFTICLTILTAILLSACSSEEPGGDAPAQDEAAGDQPANRIAIPATVRNNLGITFAPVERRRVDSTIRVPGVFELQPLARHEYRMVLPGEVELKVNQYQPVKLGDLLFRFRSPKWPELQHEIIEAEQAIASAQAAITVARSKIAETEQRLKLMKQRLEALAQADIKNADLETQAQEIEATLPRLRAELQQDETTLANAHRNREHAMHVASSATRIEEGRLSELVEYEGSKVPAYQTIDWIEVRATQPGVVERLALTDGAFAEAPSLVLSTIDPKQVRFRARALQSDLARFNGGATAMITPPSSSGIAIDDVVPAEMTIGLEAHPEQRTVALLATPSEQRDWIRPGVSAFLEVNVDSTDGYALAIPRSAIVKDGIVHVFFRRDPADPNKAIRVEADMGTNDGRWVAINSGLSLNDEVVLNGAYELKLASQQSGVSQKGGHFHADGTFHAEDH
ncbi:MAG: hypothetical protein KTR15_12140 [Phycisphaeraceae bacterium]|nr:hypothetical protein [Phycisphaeraceae bacterium]